MIPFKNNEGLQIVRSWAGNGTAETIYETEDGRQWTDDSGKREVGDMTAPRPRGKLIGNRVFT